MLTLPAGSGAHPGSALTGYVSTVSAVVPNVLGVNALVLGGDDRLRVSNYSGKTIVILGYAPDRSATKQDDSGSTSWLLIAGLGAAALLALVGVGARRARRRAPVAP